VVVAAAAVVEINSAFIDWIECTGLSAYFLSLVNGMLTFAVSVL
jgi:hypothetical protein